MDIVEEELCFHICMELSSVDVEFDFHAFKSSIRNKYHRYRVIFLLKFTAWLGMSEWRILFSCIYKLNYEQILQV